MNFVFEVDGKDITKYMNFDGLKYGVNDLDSEEAGRTLDGIMHRSRVATKIRWDIQVKKLYTDELQELFQLIRPEWVTVHYTDPCMGERVAQFYSNNYSVDLESSYEVDSGKLLWSEFSFPLIEQ